MKTTARMTAQERREAIVRAATAVFVEKGFRGTTTRQLADAAGVSEALLFKHFPSKEALYSAMVQACFEQEAHRMGEQLRSVKPSTQALVLLVEDFITHVLRGPTEEGERAFFRLVIRSLLDEGEFTRLAVQSGPKRWVRKIRACLEAARAAGDLAPRAIPAHLGGWFVFQLVTGVLLHALPGESVIDFEVPREELIAQAIRFCLRGMGLSEAALQRHLA